MKDHAIRIIALTLALLCTPVVAEIYKVVDADGNVTYTDQPPGPDSVPVELRGLSVISPQQAPVGRRSPTDKQADGSEQEEVPIRQLRRDFSDFAIVSPKPEESLWGTQNTATVAWSTRSQLQAGMKVVLYLDGKEQPPTNSPVSVFEGLYRGAHTVRAELFDSKNRRVASSKTVTFFIKQNSVNFPNAQNQGN